MNKHFNPKIDKTLHTIANRKRKRSEDSTKRDSKDKPLREPNNYPVIIDDGDEPEEVIVVDEDEDPIIRKGLGTTDAPFMFPEWVTKKDVIKSGSGALLEISDDEDKQNEHDQQDQQDEYDEDENDEDENDEDENDEDENDEDENDEDENDEDENDEDENDEDENDEDENDEDENDEDENDEEDKVDKEIYGEVDEEVPELTLSQQTVETDTFNSQSKSQDTSHTPKPFHSLQRKDADKIFVHGPKDVESTPSGLRQGNALNFESEYNKDEPMPLEQRKRLFLRTYWRHKIPTLKRVIQEYYSILKEDRSADSCWLYNGRRLPKPPNQCLHITVRFKHNRKSEQLSFNVVFISMLLKGMLSTDQIEGISKHSWHASHLCGNWTCLNERHVHPEPGAINLSRNPCFRDRYGMCSHIPVCQKHLKIANDILRPTYGSQAEIHHTDGNSYSASP